MSRGLTSLYLKYFFILLLLLCFHYLLPPLQAGSKNESDTDNGSRPEKSKAEEVITDSHCCLFAMWLSTKHEFNLKSVQNCPYFPLTSSSTRPVEGASINMALHDLVMK